MKETPENIKSIAEAVIAGILTLNPITNALAASVSSYMATRRDRQLQTFFAQMNCKQEELASYIDVDYFQTDEFCAMASKALFKIMTDL